MFGVIIWVVDCLFVWDKVVCFVVVCKLVVCLLVCDVFGWLIVVE